jgi:glycosyltransferase involved in cell wall biosynthesis
MGTRFGFVSTYPPTHCGIATFSSSLIAAIQDDNANRASVIRLVDSDNENVTNSNSADVVSVMRAGNPQTLAHAVSVLNELDVAIIQHEFGIYGGVDGDEAITLLEGLRIPTIVVLHTVLSAPTENQRAVFVKICSLASALVTMSKSARDQLVANYLIDPRKIYPIPHGARSVADPEYKEIGTSPLIWTWGLIGPGKGIEWAIEAMHKIRNLDCSPRYVVAGRTHPKVLERNGESYRKSLQNRINDLGLNKSVLLQGGYMNSQALDELVSKAALVLLPYDSTDQATSGVLIEAITAWRPVVATKFPHAKELLSTGAGIVVSHRDPTAMAEAIRQILEEPMLAERMSNQARVMASNLLWPAVATRYIRLAGNLIRAQVAA